MTALGPYATEAQAQAVADLLNTDMPVAVCMQEADRFTLAPLYIPDKADSDNHTIGAEALQKALWDWMEHGKREINFQHTARRAGTMVEAACWPLSVDCELQKGDGTSEPVNVPAGTPWIGVRWEPWAWEMLQRGEIAGYSLAGIARPMR